jgi:hypothetical protein
MPPLPRGGGGCGPAVSTKVLAYAIMVSITRPPPPVGPQHFVGPQHLFFARTLAGRRRSPDKLHGMVQAPQPRNHHRNAISKNATHKGQALRPTRRGGLEQPALRKHVAQGEASLPQPYPASPGHHPAGRLRRCLAPRPTAAPTSGSGRRVGWSGGGGRAPLWPVPAPGAAPP